MMKAEAIEPFVNAMNLAENRKKASVRCYENNANHSIKANDNVVNFVADVCFLPPICCVNCLIQSFMQHQFVVHCENCASDRENNPGQAFSSSNQFATSEDCEGDCETRGRAESKLKGRDVCDEGIFVIRCGC